MSLEVTYKNSQIAQLTQDGSLTLNTAGKYCEDDIGLTYSGGGATENTGSITIASDTDTVEFAHGLSQTPTIVLLYTDDPTTGSTSPPSFRSIIASVFGAEGSGYRISNAIVYSSSGSRYNLIETTVTIGATTVSVVSGSVAYNFKAGKTYNWRAIV